VGFACVGGACAPLLACTSGAGCSADTGGPGGPCVGGFCLPLGSAGCTGDAMCPSAPTGARCAGAGPAGACLWPPPPPPPPPPCNPTCSAPAVCTSSVDFASGGLVSSCVLPPPALPDRVCLSWNQPARGDDSRIAVATAYGGSGPFYFTWDMDDKEHPFAPTMSATSTATGGSGNNDYYGVGVTLAPYGSRIAQPTVSYGREMKSDTSGCWCSDNSACPS
jgi:hypothetical protein